MLGFLIKTYMEQPTCESRKKSVTKSIFTVCIFLKMSTLFVSLSKEHFKQNLFKDEKIPLSTSYEDSFMDNYLVVLYQLITDVVPSL